MPCGNRKSIAPPLRWGRPQAPPRPGGLPPSFSSGLCPFLLCDRRPAGAATASARTVSISSRNSSVSHGATLNAFSNTAVRSTSVCAFWIRSLSFASVCRRVRRLRSSVLRGRGIVFSQKASPGCLCRGAEVHAPTSTLGLSAPPRGLDGEDRQLRRALLALTARALDLCASSLRHRQRHLKALLQFRHRRLISYVGMDSPSF
jgi:hypothetical protein